MKVLAGLFFIFSLTARFARAESFDEVYTSYEKKLFLETNGRISEFINYNTILAVTSTRDWEEGEIVPIFSQQPNGGVVGYVEIKEIRNLPDGQYQLLLELKRHSKEGLIQLKDYVVRIDLSKSNEIYKGTTELLVKQRTQRVSSRYRPLVYQGFAIGETAQTLWKQDVLVNFLGLTYYGVTDWLTVGALLPGFVFNNPNLLLRIKAYDSDSNIFSIGGSIVRVAQTGQSTLNLNLLWDSVSSESLIQHTFLSLGLVTWEGAEDAAAIKALGSSSLQTGYEFILNNWNRVLLGPNYNFEKRAVGGYISHMWIFDRLHFQVSLNTTNISRFRLDPTDGYYGGFDLFWRF